MQRYLGKEVTLLEWYGRTRLKDDFSLRALVDETLIDALDG
jgi:RNA ligase